MKKLINPAIYKLLIIFLLTIIILSSISYSFFLNQATTGRYMPLMYTMQQVQLKITTAHLWFEEIISGDRYVSINTVWSKISESENLLKAVLSENNNRYAIVLIKNPKVKIKINKMIELTKNFRFIGEKRWHRQSTSVAGSQIDQEFDRVFKELINSIQNTQVYLEQQTKLNISQFNTMQGILIIAATIMSLFIGVLLIRHQRNSIMNMESIKRQEQQVMDLLNSTAEGIIGVDINGLCSFANPASLKMLGFQQLNELLGKNIHNLIHYKKIDETDYSIKECPMHQTLISGKKTHVIDEVLWRNDGSWFYAEYLSHPIFRDGKVTGGVISFMDISQRKEAELTLEQAYYELDYRVKERTKELSDTNKALSLEVLEHKKTEDKLRYLSTHDTLTGLCNRKLLEQRLEKDVQRAERYKHPLSIFLIDIDHFKHVNDTHGHQAGDIVLQGFANLANKVIRQTDYAARYGGEEFIIALPETPLFQAERLAERLRLEVAEHLFKISDNKKINITISIGLADYPNSASSLHELIKVSDAAMYKAKQSGRNQVKKGSCIRNEHSNNVKAHF